MKKGVPGKTAFGQQRGKEPTEDILHLNVGGKRYNVRRSVLLADADSKLAVWFCPSGGPSRLSPADKWGTYFLERDPKSFRHVLAYLRFKRERCAGSMALPLGPDELAKLVCECDALCLEELKGMATDMLHKYLLKDEQHFAISFAQMTLRDYNAWRYESDRGNCKLPPLVERKKGAMKTEGGDHNSSEEDEEWAYGRKY